MSRQWPGKSLLLPPNITLGPNYAIALTTFFVILSLSLLCLFVPCLFFLTDKRTAAPLIISASLGIGTVFSFIATAGSDPGLIPHQRSEWSQGPVQTPKFGSTLLEYDGRAREVAVRGVLVRLQYCDTCNRHTGCIYRPPRTVHCHVCDSCVQQFDHHCPWLGTCIGRRNYSYFLLFLSFSSLHWLFALIISTSHVIFLFQTETSTTFAAQKLTGTWVLLSFSLLSLIFVVGLWSFHLYLSTHGKTTHEKLKKLHQTYNPYSLLSPISNFLSIFQRKNQSLLTKPIRCNEDEDFLVVTPSLLAVRWEEMKGKREEFKSTEIEPLNTGRFPVQTDISSI